MILKNHFETAPFVELEVGFEPTTPSLRVKCSTPELYQRAYYINTKQL